MVNYAAAPAASADLAMSASNDTLFDAMLPPLPTYHLQPKPDLFSYITDFGLSLILPVLAYWSVSFVFHIVDSLDLFPQYRLHPPEEILRRNHASRYEVARDVIVQQVIQIATGAALGLLDGPDLTGKEEYDVAVWATRVRLVQRALPPLLGLVGINAMAISKSMSASHPFLAGALAGGHYPVAEGSVGGPTFAAWETMAASIIYHFVVPALQFVCAIFVLDTWQYFLHRLMHVNRWMYTVVHSRHHRLYVPYAYGALYNHPLEGFLLDTLGAAIGFKISGMTMRQSIFFFTFSTIKTVDDHCGYAFPWDPLQLVTGNNAAYHDIHHQTWGIKTNFSQPFFTFWDTLLGTKYTGPRTDRLADKKRAANGAANGVANGKGSDK